MKQLFIRTFRHSFRVTLVLLKIYIPLSILTAVLKQLGVLDMLAPLFAPFMRFFGLPGEASIVLILAAGNALYSALGAMAAMDLDFRQITIIAVMAGIAHNLLVETAILMKLKTATPVIALFRLVFSFAAGFLMNLVLPQTVSGTVLNPYAEAEIFTWPGFIAGMLITAVQIYIVLFLLMLSYELAAAWKHTESIKKKLVFIPKILGLGDNASGPWFVGFIIGITYGAGILYQLEEKNALKYRDGILITVFLCIAHAMVEDTLLFVILGGNLGWILAGRIVLAFAVVRILSFRDLFRKFLWLGLRKE
jgi:hypothetical protein